MAIGIDRPLEYDNIYLQGKQSKSSGKIKLISGGIGWKESATGLITTLKSEEFKKLNWLKVARDYQLRITLNNGNIFKFDGFLRDAFDTLKEFSKENYDIFIESKEISLKGWNWGKMEVQNDNLEFIVQGKTMIEVPLSEISNAVVSSKNEVTVEVSQNEAFKKMDSLVDIRFYVPPSTNEEVNEESVDAATVFCSKLKPTIEAVGTESIVSFQELPFLVPRGRYEADLYASFLRLRGKSYDYKILYSSILRIFLLPKPDDLHVIMAISLDPPLRQGQTRYPFLIIQFSIDSEIQTSLTLTDEIKEKFSGKLEEEYEGPQYEVVSNLIKIVAEKKIIVPGSFKSYHGTKCIKCSMKAYEGHLYFLEKSFIFIPKPTTLILHDDLVSITFSRVDGSVANSRTFDMKFSIRGGPEQSFSNINKEELSIIEDFLRDKKIKFQNELIDSKKKVKYGVSGSSSEDDIPAKSDADDEESTDEDFKEGDDISDVVSSSETDASVEEEY